MAEPRSTGSAIGLPPAEAIAFLRQKTDTTSEHWTDLWNEAHSRGFMVAGAASQALVSDFRAAIAKALEQGTTLVEFRRDFDTIVAKHGWVHHGTAAWRAQIIYETNLSMAYAAGRYAQMTEPDTLRVYPYWQYQHTSSARPRPQHLAWVGTTLRADDPWWGTHYPPNGWRCRCSVRPVSAAGLARQGKAGPDEAPPVEWKTYRIKQGVNAGTVRVPVGIDPGFGYNPGAAWVGESPPATGAPRLPRLPPAEAVQPPTPADTVALPAPVAPLSPPPPPPSPLRQPPVEAVPAQDRFAPIETPPGRRRLAAATKPWADALTEAESNALDTYKGPFGFQMNKALRGLAEDPIAKDLADTLAAALDQSSLSLDILAFRGVKGVEERRYRTAAVGDVVDDGGFLSTSLSREKALKFGPYLVRLRLPAGMRGAAYVHPFPRRRHLEYEVLLNRGMRLRVVEKTDDGAVVEIADDDR